MGFYKRILWIIVIATAVLYLLNMVYQVGNRKYYKHEMSRLDVLVDKNFYADILFMGSSRTHVHNNPRIVDSITHLSSYNFGVEGGNLVEINLWLQVYLQKHVKPKMIVLDLPAFAFDINRRTFFNHTIYFPYMNNAIIYKTLLKYKNVRLYKYIPFLKFMEVDDYNKFNAVRGLVGSIDPQSAAYGYKGYIENGTDSIKSNSRTPHDTTTYKITTAGKDLLNAIIDSCKKKNIQLLLTYSPEYYDADYTNRGAFFKYVEEAAMKNQLVFLDYRKSAICRDNRLFLNPGHLNKFGATAFSAELANDILEQIRE